MLCFETKPVHDPENARKSVIIALKLITEIAKQIPERQSEMSAKDQAVLAMLRDATEQILHDNDILEF